MTAMNAPAKGILEKSLYDRQNTAIHVARQQVLMTLDGCRELARQISGKPSISSLTLRERWDLIELLKAKGAEVSNPPLPPAYLQSKPAFSGHGDEDFYSLRLDYWNKKFPRRRPGFASNRELAWIEALWRFDFDDGRSADSFAGLRGFLYRQTRKLKNGPVSDLPFLLGNHVSAILTPLKAKARKSKDERRR